MSRASKGSAFEREICTKLSLWWTQDLDEPRDDVFWRSSNSGGRATSRNKKGKGTHGQSGDVAATDPIGAPLLRFTALELKRGYKSATIMDVMDKSQSAKMQTFELWVQQAKASAFVSHAISWMIIFRRDRRIPMVMTELKYLVNARVFDNLESMGSGSCIINMPSATLEYNYDSVLVMPLELWLELVTPKIVRKVIWFNDSSILAHAN